VRRALSKKNSAAKGGTTGQPSKQPEVPSAGHVMSKALISLSRFVPSARHVPCSGGPEKGVIATPTYYMSTPPTAAVLTPTPPIPPVLSAVLSVPLATSLQATLKPSSPVAVPASHATLYISAASRRCCPSSRYSPPSHHSSAGSTPESHSTHLDPDAPVA
jgi:hypothetical protein